MAGGVKALTFLVQPLRIEIGEENSLLVPQRAREELAVRSDDRRAAAADQLVALRERHVGRIARGALEDAARKDERARLSRNMTHRLEPLLRVVGRGREVQLDAGLVERRTGERHQVFPADEAADF